MTATIIILILAYGIGGAVCLMLGLVIGAAGRGPQEREPMEMDGAGYAKDRALIRRLRDERDEARAEIIRLQTCLNQTSARNRTLARKNRRSLTSSHLTN